MAALVRMYIQYHTSTFRVNHDTEFMTSAGEKLGVPFEPNSIRHRFVKQ